MELSLEGIVIKNQAHKIDELEVLIRQLEADNRDLHLENAKLNEKLGLNSKTSSTYEIVDRCAKPNKLPKNSRRHKRYDFKTHKGPPPGLDDPECWYCFYASDETNSRSISQEELISAICRTVRASSVQMKFLRDKIQESWSKFDKNNDMLITKHEFMNNQNGMVSFLINLEKECKRMRKHAPVTVNTAHPRKPAGNPPPLSKGKEWYCHYDNNLLSKEEIIHGICESLKAHSPKEKDVIRDTIENAWLAFDIDNDGEISRGEFLGEAGLHDYLLLLEQEWIERPNDRNTYNFLNLCAKGGYRHNYLPPPSLATDPGKWFDHVDYDHSKEISQKELTYGLIVSFNANSSEKRRAIRDLIIRIWDRYDLNGDNVISKKEFMAEDGLANMLIKLKQNWEQRYNSSKDEVALTIQIKVFIPRNTKAGDITQVCSPKTQEIVVIQIPDKIVWNGGGEDPYYIVVSF